MKPVILTGFFNVTQQLLAIVKICTKIIMSKDVLKYLTSEGLSPQEEYNQGLALLMQNPASRNAVRSYNNKGYSKQGLENLKYDLKKSFGIKDQDIRKYKEDITPVIEERTLEGFLEENKDRVQELLSEIPEDALKGMKLYGKYTFLRSPDCPNEFKILVGDAITAFENYKAGHEELFTKVASLADPLLDENEIFEIANQVLEDFELNREIHAELQHYADTGEILGKHEIFADYNLAREISKLTAAELAGRSSNLKSYISKANKLINTSKNPEEVEAAKVRLANLKKEKALVDKTLKAKK
ncbi:hypothetical protein EG346_15980 [Chryseobacterium carnipullorum]|uniref:Uncharacterized protein n=2 Tax=Chryseobacterium carnipullorum TaxID=1124835 RepID=A0A376DU09_CHRCU|nr:hypothetical protein EG346_15980 [Chryseobacterium carnipullorum]STC94894.1 Uncharacterised protein [Chryseobacterium carnipullorum]